MGAGRPSKYKDAFVQQAFRLSLLGLNDVEMASFFDVSPDTIYEWKKKHPPFSEAIQKGKVEADGKVARSLYRMALGFTKTFRTQVATKEGPVEIKRTIYMAPDVKAALRWLENRQPDKWRQKQGSPNEEGTREPLTIKINGQEIEVG